MSDIWNKRREILEKALIEATLSLFEHTGSNAFELPIPGTSPVLKVVAGEFNRKPAEPVAGVPDGMVLVSRKDAEAVARFAFNNAGRGLRAPVASAGERILDSLKAPPTNQQGAAP